MTDRDPRRPHCVEKPDLLQYSLILKLPFCFSFMLWDHRHGLLSRLPSLVLDQISAVGLTDDTECPGNESDVLIQRYVRERCVSA